MQDLPKDIDTWMKEVLGDTVDNRSRRKQMYSKINEIPYVSVNHMVIEKQLSDEQLALEMQASSEEVVKQLPIEIIWPPPDESKAQTPSPGDIEKTPGDTSPEPFQVADWMLPEHRTPFCLAMSLYSTASANKAGYRLLESTPRVGAWYNDTTSQLFIGCRGTNPFKTEFSKDLYDDLIVAMGKFNVVAVQIRQTILDEANAMVTRMRAKGYAYDNMMIGGHSLGGFAALTTGHAFNLRACAWNAAAPIINPLTLGPGPTKATHYHIIGDLISTHVSPLAANNVRVLKGEGWGFAAWEHDQGRFLQSDPTMALWTADQENDAYYRLIVTMKLQPTSEELMKGIQSSIGLNAIMAYITRQPSVAALLLVLLTLYPVPGCTWWYITDFIDIIKLINRVLWNRTPPQGYRRAQTGRNRRIGGPSSGSGRTGSNPGRGRTGSNPHRLS